MQPSTVGAVLIGDEILSGSIKDRNSDYIIKSFAPIGYDVREIRVIPDDTLRIGRAASELSREYEIVISSGGVGPTHDDITFEGVALGFGVALVESVKILSFLRERYGMRMHDDLIRMAMIPEGADVLLEEIGSPWPVVRFRNIYILPGLPRAFEDKIDRICASLTPAGSFHGGQVFLTADESDYVTWLNAFQRKYPDLSVGSYPYWDQPEYQTKITVRGKNSESVSKAMDELSTFVRARNWFVREERT
ncbi:MAG: competence/damage-inducible protein A [Spirochaetaceae bacterium]